jgi:hypothetical protein
LKTIADLENEGFIEITKDEHKAKKYHLSINRNKVLVSLIEDLDQSPPSPTDVAIDSMFSIGINIAPF